MLTLKEQYLAYLESDHWSNLRAEAMANANNQCESCKSPGPLHGHHLQYRQFTDCTSADIMSLCECCHTLWHHYFSASIIRSRDFVLGFLSGVKESAGELVIATSEATASGIVEIETKLQRQAKRELLKMSIMTDKALIAAAKELPPKKFRSFIRSHFKTRSKKSACCNYAHQLYRDLRTLG